VPLGSKISAQTKIQVYFLFRHIHKDNFNSITSNWFRKFSSGNGDASITI